MRGVRSYLAGTGASGSLLLAALVAAVSVTALLAFDGLPFGAGQADPDTVSLARPDDSSIAPAVAALAIADTPAAVAATPATPVAPVAPVGPLGVDAPLLAAAAAGTPPADLGGDSAVNAPASGTATQAEAPPLAAANRLDQIVADLDSTVEGVTGANPGLGPTAKPITGLADQALQSLTGNDLGGNLDNLGLGE